jgi:cold shock CspA family protein
MRGSVTRLNKKIGCGFILGEDGLEAYFDLSSLEGIDIQAISIGRTVEYQEHFGNERLRAVRVRVMPNPQSKSAVGSEK